MRLLRRFRNIKHRNRLGSESGIALFMVLSSVSVLAMLATEFSYVSQVNSRMAYNGLDQLKAHYVAKAALKLSLLRLKAYSSVRKMLGGTSAPANPIASAVPQKMVDMIWSFPILFPIPANAPGISPTQRDSILKFQEKSTLAGRFSAAIESESSKLNLNSAIAAFALPTPAPAAAQPPQPPVIPGQPAPPPPANPAQPGQPIAFDAEQARKGLTDYFTTVLNQKMQNDAIFADAYRGFPLGDLLDQIFGWSDVTYQSRRPQRNGEATLKRAPFYSLAELHMVPTMDDRLYDLFAPGLTVSAQPQLNINTASGALLRSILTNLTEEEATAIIRYRDDEGADHSFRQVQDFYTYLKDNVGSYRSDQAIQQLKDEIQKRNLALVTAETEFKVTVTAQVNSASRKIETWVSLSPRQNSGGSGAPAAPGAQVPAGAPPPSSPVVGGVAPSSNTGLHILYMRIL